MVFLRPIFKPLNWTDPQDAAEDLIEIADDRRTGYFVGATSGKVFRLVRSPYRWSAMQGQMREDGSRVRANPA